MKQSWPQVVWFCGGAILGQFSEIILFPLWAKLGLLIPIGRWIALFGSTSLDWGWLLVYIWLVSWLIVALVSVIGGLFIRRNLLRSMLLFGVGFAFVPLILNAYLYSIFPGFADYVQHIVVVGVAVLCGLLGQMLGSRIRRASQQPPPGLSGN
jgi:hypothetical protein